jgi:hypothetical protein
MRNRLVPAGAVLALLLGLLTAAPAAAAVPAVESITFPGGFSEFYSPFSGPATIRFTFDGSEEDATFNFRIRIAGGSMVHRKDNVFVDADDPAGFDDEPFKWPALSVNSARTYVVTVYRSDVKLASESFLLRPRLATITGITPDPFLPWIEDGYKDDTTVRFTLLENADAEARVFKANSAGKCCGSRVRDEQLGALSAGSNQWEWDGRGEEAFAGLQPKGNYFVKIWADDGVVAPAVSKPLKVAIARSYRAVKTKSKPARDYHHRSAVTPLVLGGDCYVMRGADDLRILCQGARVSVYWRWGLSGSQRIERASFVVDTQVGSCPSSIRRKGHTKYESRFTVNEDLVGALGDCRIVTAKITYSYPKQS